MNTKPSLPSVSMQPPLQYGEEVWDVERELCRRRGEDRVDRGA